MGMKVLKKKEGRGIDRMIAAGTVEIGMIVRVIQVEIDDAMKKITKDSRKGMKGQSRECGHGLPLDHEVVIGLNLHGMMIISKREKKETRDGK